VALYSPWVLVLLALGPLTAYLMMRRGGRARLRFSSLRDARRVGASWRVRLRPVLMVLRLLCVVLLVVALARPRHGSQMHRVAAKGVAMQLVVDRSGSMEARMSYGGKEMSRLDVVKRVLGDFVKGGEELAGRPNDLIGLVTFARYADTTCPLVHAHDAVLGFLKQTPVVGQRSAENATAIGDAISLAAARLKTAEEELTRRNRALQGTTREGEDSRPAYEIRSKVIVLLTDGRNNAGEHEPMAAVALAKEWGIKVYTVGIGGGEGGVRVQGLFGDFLMPSGQEFDEALLKAMAKETGGFYGRADDGEALRTLCQKIDEQEKSEIETVEYSRYEERFGPWALGALAVLALEIMLGCTVLRKIP